MMNKTSDFPSIIGRLFALTAFMILRMLYGSGKYRLTQSLERRPDTMQIAVSPQPVVSLIAGILIFIFPKLLNYIVAIYLIVIGILGLIR